MTTWPRDNQRELIAFYGDPGTGAVERQLVACTPPFQMYYDGKSVRTIKFHRKAAPALMAALNDIWDHYDRNQDKIDELGISKYAGTYNPRKVRGSATKWSNHAFGAAIDINAEENGMYTKGNIPLPVIAAFKKQGARWGGDYRGRKDPMHFEFCRDANAPSYGIISRAAADELPDIDSDSDGNGAVEDLGEVSPRQRTVGISEIADTAGQISSSAQQITTTVKPMFKSHISTATVALGASSAATVATAAPPSLWQQFLDVWKSPFWWMLCINLVLVGYILYHYWRDHGKGALQK